MDEFNLIETFFKPLSAGCSGSLNLNDDAAIIPVPPGCELVITKDAISEGVHFLGNEDPALIARKLLRVNLSDLAAMGAKPMVYFLALILPKHLKSDWVKRFAEGLKEDQERFSIHLAGGDTISTHGPLSCSLTAIGTITSGKALRRSSAQPGDSIYVSGTLGDSALGLGLLQDSIKHTLPREGASWLEQRYFLPEPRLLLGQRLTSIAHAAMDISDGLVQDLGHICTTSGTGAAIQRHLLPLSEPAATLIKADKHLWQQVLSGGDDYELLFTVPAGKTSDIGRLAIELSLPLTAIGKITGGSEVQVMDDAGNPLAITHKGFKHF